MGTGSSKMLKLTSLRGPGKRKPSMKRKVPNTPKPRKGQSKRTKDVVRRSFSKEAREDTAIMRQKAAKSRGIKNPPRVQAVHSMKRKKK